MADRICTACGAANPPTATFCGTCDAYVDWGDPVTTDDATPRGVPPDAGAPATDAGPATGDPTGSPTTAGPEPDVRAPVATVGTTDVVVAPGRPGTTTVQLRNVSDVVDGLVVHPTAPPPWLVVTHEDAHLMPGESRTVTVTFAARPGALVVAQRAVLDLAVRSSVDPTRATHVEVTLTVPRVGPPPTLTARPALLELADDEEGVLTMTVDNRAANFPRRYRLAAHDPQDVVRARFLPPVVDVPAGEAVDVSVRVTAPAPPPGSEVTRQVTVTGVGDDEQVAAAVTLVQRTAAPPPHVPVRVRLEPSHLRSDDGGVAAFDVVVDNRAGHEAAAVALVGRDPAHAVGFAFGEERLVVPAGRAARVRAHARAQAPQPGTTRSLPFVVVVADGTSEVEAPGVLEVAARPAPISTARLWVEPATLVTQRRGGTYLVHVDNRRGGDPLQVRLAGADELGRARLTFTPATVVVPPGLVGTVRLAVDAARPPVGTSTSRRLRVAATDGREAVETEAVLSQSTPDRRPVVKRWLVWLGAALAVLGALRPWIGRAIDPEAVVWEATAAVEGDREAIAFTATASSSVLVLLLALLMLLGLNGSRGRGIRFAALLMVPLALVAGVLGTPANGLVIVLVGAVLGFVGGVLARATAPGR